MSTVAQSQTRVPPRMASGASAWSLPSGLPALVWLTRRELVRFARQPSRIVAAVGTPLLLWLFFGAGFAGTVAVGDGASYRGYLLPGMASLAVMFSSIFAAMSLIEDRRAGFLQSVLASPAPRWAVVGAKVTGGSIIAAAQGALILLMAPLLGIPVTLQGFAMAVAALVVISVAINGLGLAAAWRIDSTQGFHGVMNLVLMPMWMLSGAIFPLTGAAVWLQALMLINPLYWPTAALRQALLGNGNEPVIWQALWLVSLVVGIAGFTLAWTTVGRIRPARRGARR
jgi:ABC-2 type transport system permease protein